MMDDDTVEKLRSGDYYPVEAGTVKMADNLIYSRDERGKAYFYLILER